MPIEANGESRQKADLVSRDFLSVTSLTVMLGDLTEEERLLDRILGEFCSQETYQQQYGKGRYREGATPLGLRALLAIVAYGKYRRVHSSRHLAALARESMVCRYLSGNVVPSHTAINHFIKNSSEILEAFFSYSVQIACENGMVSFRNVNIDGTKANANGSSNKGTRLRELIDRNERAKQAIQEYLRKVLENDLREDADETERNVYRSIIDEAGETIEALEKKIQKLQTELDEAKAGGTEKLCFNDPGARVMRSGHSKAVQGSQNIQSAMDADFNIVVAVDSTSEVNDIHQLHGMTSLSAAEAERNGMELKEVTADKGYGNIDEITEVESGLHVKCNVDIQSYPKEWLLENSQIIADPESPDKKAPRVICPGKQEMTTSGRLHEAKRMTFWRYRISLKKCEGCPFSGVCLKKKETEDKAEDKAKKKQEGYRELCVNKNWYNWKVYEKKLKEDPEMRQKIGKRKGHVEGCFAYLKQELAYRGLPRSGSKQGTVECKMIFSLYNIKRVINYTRQRYGSLVGITVSRPSEKLLQTSF